MGRAHDGDLHLPLGLLAAGSLIDEIGFAATAPSTRRPPDADVGLSC